MWFGFFRPLGVTQPWWEDVRRVLIDSILDGLVKNAYITLATSLNTFAYIVWWAFFIITDSYINIRLSYGMSKNAKLDIGQTEETRPTLKEDCKRALRPLPADLDEAKLDYFRVIWQ